MFTVKLKRKLDKDLKRWLGRRRAVKLVCDERIESSATTWIYTFGISICSLQDNSVLRYMRERGWQDDDGESLLSAFATEVYNYLKGFYDVRWIQKGHTLVVGRIVRRSKKQVKVEKPEEPLATEEELSGFFAAARRILGS